LLQKHIESTKIEIDEEGKECKPLNTMLRVYYVNCPESSGTPRTYLEMLASKDGRVSGAGYTIPLSRNFQVASENVSDLSPN